MKSFCLTEVSAAGRGGDRRPAGAEAPTPGGRSSRATRGTAGGRTPAAARQREGRGAADVFLKSVKAGCPKAGWGVVGGKGLASPLPPAARRAGDQARMPGKSCQLAEKKRHILRRRAASVKRRGGEQATKPGCRARAASQRQKKENACAAKTPAAGYSSRRVRVMRRVTASAGFSPEKRMLCTASVMGASTPRRAARS